MPTNGGIIGPENKPVKTKSAVLATTAFTSNGTLTSNPATEVADIMVIAGGAGGSPATKQPYGGGGGAGGLLRSQNITMAANSPFSVTIGAGGASGSAGVDSVFANPAFPMNADGGGTGSTGTGSTGGSGGGAVSSGGGY